MSGNQTHVNGSLKAQILAALAKGPMSTKALAAAIKYDHTGNALAATLYFHTRQGTLESKPWVGRQTMWGLPGAEFPPVPETASSAKAKLATPPTPRLPKVPKRVQRAIALLEAAGYTVTKGPGPALQLPPADPPLARPAPPPKAVATSDGETVEAFLARGGKIDRIPTPEPVPFVTVPAFPGTR